MNFTSTKQLLELRSSEVLALIPETNHSFALCTLGFVGEHKMHQLAGTSKVALSYLVPMLRKKEN